jgi:hypothetical protein
MVKKFWIAIALVAGVVLGLLLGSHGAHLLGFSTGEAADWPRRQIAAEHAATGPATPAAAPGAAPAAVPRGAVTEPAPAPAPPAQPPAAPAPPASVSFIIENAETERFDYANYSGYSLPVDAGPLFGAQIAESIRDGRRDTVAQEHVKLEREMRDDSWSFPVEAELHNMLAVDPVMGRFKVEHVECRATLCEVRVSGRDRPEQADDINQWLSDMHRLPWPGGLTVGSAVFAATEGGSEGMLMLRRQAAPPD